MTSTAELVLADATVYTGDPEQPWATHLAIADGRILAVGDSSSVAGYTGRHTSLHRADGAFVMPGLVDVHNHHALAGKADLFELSLPVDADFDEILDAVHTRATELGPMEWVIGGRWGSTLAARLGNSASREALDRAAEGRPVLLVDDSQHCRWANTQALALAGVTAATPDPAGGTIVRDSDTGAPTGLLLEEAGLLLERAARSDGVMTDSDQVRASRRGVQMLHQYGVTAFCDAGVSTDIMGALKTLDDNEELSAWVVTSMLVNDPLFGVEPLGEELIAQRERFRSPHHRPDFVKIFLDGVPPTRTAAFLEPYLPDDAYEPGYRGHLAMATGELRAWLQRCAQEGLSAKVHCTGDASVRAVLDAVAAVRRAGHHDVRFHIAHGQFVHPDDLPRFAELGVDADISPFLWVPGVIPDAIATVLPASRAGQMQPNRTLLDTGALVAGGSDWPVSVSPDPWEGIAGLVTRSDPSGRRPGALWPEQALTLKEAIAVFTVNAARSMGIDDVTGSLTPGKSADFVVLNHNPFQVAETALATTSVIETWFAGRNVFRRS